MMKTLLFNPFKKYSEKTLLTTGWVLLVLGSFLAFYLKARYDGVLDLHFVKNIAWHQPFLDNLINIFSLTLILFALGKHLNKKTRLVDILNTALIARFPYYLMTLMNIDGYMAKSSRELLAVLGVQNNELTTSELATIDPQAMIQMLSDSLGFIILSSVSGILILVWGIILLYNGFKVAVNAKGTKPVILFSLGILVAEILSKCLIYIF